MRMRCHLDSEKDGPFTLNLREGITSQKDGLVVLESEPQLRTMFVHSQFRNHIRVPLPHIIFTIRYIEEFNGFMYPGFYGRGLHVFGCLKPLSDFSDKVFYLPTDLLPYRGLVCTNHGSDKMVFETIPKLVNHVVELWYGAKHYIDYDPFPASRWSDVDLNEIKNGKWEKAGNFRKNLLENRVYGKPLDIPLGAKVVDVDWDTFT